MSEEQVRVLLVDDDEDDFVITRDLLREVHSLKVELEWQRTYSAGLRAVLEQRHDLYLFDYVLGEKDGLALVRAAQERDVRMPMILLTACDAEEIEAFAAHSGVADYLVKSELTPRLLGRSLRYALAEKRTRARLAQAQRLASLGTLAGGVAHEINNPLAVVLTNTDFAIEEISGVHGAPGTRLSANERQRLDDARIALREVLESAQRVRQIVRDMATFARSDDEVQGPLDVRKVLDDVLPMLPDELRGRARVVRAFGEVPKVHGNHARLARAFLQLLSNAVQAVAALPAAYAASSSGADAGKNGAPEDQEQERSLAAALQAPEVVLSTRTDEHGRAVVEFRDIGAGIPKEIVDRIFDPFFTTKEVGAGTGLGLSVVHGTISAMGGQISVESPEGQGTRVTVVLPQAVITAASPATQVERTADRGRVLVIDDEAMVARAIRRTLGKEHDVVLAGRASEALERVRAGERFDIVLCDLMMPDVTGMAFYGELEKIAPDLAARVVFLTGGAFTAEARSFLERMPGRWMEKPFDPGRLRALLRAQPPS